MPVIFFLSLVFLLLPPISEATRWHVVASLPPLIKIVVDKYPPLSLFLTFLSHPPLLPYSLPLLLLYVGHQNHVSLSELLGKGKGKWAKRDTKIRENGVSCVNIFYTG